MRYIMLKRSKGFMLAETVVGILILGILSLLFLIILKSAFGIKDQAYTVYRIDEEAFYISSYLRKELKAIEGYRVDKKGKYFFTIEGKEIYYINKDNILKRMDGDNYISTHVKNFDMSIDLDTNMLLISFSVFYDDNIKDYELLILLECDRYES